ncbi:MAG: helix-turn-helix transcriptional regulator [Prevotella sp.]|nr:helix-turn-helix transcriptional regulator [Prevotella sp.]
MHRRDGSFCAESTVSRLISGRMTLTVRHLYLFAEALGISPKDLLVE